MIFPENYQGQVERPLLSSASKARRSTVLGYIQQFMHGINAIKNYFILFGLNRLHLQCRDFVYA